MVALLLEYGALVATQSMDSSNLLRPSGSLWAQTLASIRFHLECLELHPATCVKTGGSKTSTSVSHKIRAKRTILSEACVQRDDFCFCAALSDSVFFFRMPKRLGQLFDQQKNS